MLTVARSCGVLEQVTTRTQTKEGAGVLGQAGIRDKINVLSLRQLGGR
jgi:hypothetical protein